MLTILLFRQTETVPLCGAVFCARAMVNRMVVNRLHLPECSHAPVYRRCGRTLCAPTVTRLHMNQQMPMHVFFFAFMGRRAIIEIDCRKETAAMRTALEAAAG